MNFLHQNLKVKWCFLTNCIYADLIVIEFFNVTLQEVILIFVTKKVICIILKNYWNFIDVEGFRFVLEIYMIIYNF